MTPKDITILLYLFTIFLTATAGIINAVAGNWAAAVACANAAVAWTCVAWYALGDKP
jgi:hypothetical protein